MAPTNFIAKKPLMKWITFLDVTDLDRYEGEALHKSGSQQ